MPKVSKEVTGYAVHCFGLIKGMACNDGKAIHLTREEYERQLMNPDARWKCPYCGSDAWWDDEIYEKYFWGNDVDNEDGTVG